MFEINANIKVDGTQADEEAMTALAEAELPIKYTVPFSWGNLRVTEAANQAYDLVPLVEGVQQGDIYQSQPRLSSDVVDLRLIGPSEVPSASQKETVGLFLATMPNEEDSIDVNAAFHLDRNESIDRVGEMLRSALDIDEEEFAERITDFENDLTMEESLQRMIPQVMIHTLCEALPMPLEMVYADMKKQEFDSAALRKATVRGGVLAVLGAGLGMGVAGPNAAGEVTMAAYFTVGLWVARNTIRDHMAQASFRQRIIEAHAAGIAEAVREDLHKTYCLRHFDQQAEEQLAEE